MRVVIAMMKHETNTFSPVPTPIGRFARGQPLPPRGRAAYEAYKGTGSAMAAFIDIAEREGWEVSTPIAAGASPSARVEDAAYAAMTDAICEAVAAGCDAVMLDLHGAMVTESLEDGEGALLARIRQIKPGIPIAVALDMHTNLYPEIADNVTVLAGYQTYPHIDNYETGRRAGEALVKAVKGTAAPAVAWGNRPMLPHVMRQGTFVGPNKALQERAAAMEASGEAMIATLFTGFPHADISQAGLSAVVVTDGDPAKAQRLCDELLDQAWRQRADWVYQIEPLATSLARAKAATAGPVVLLDHYDNSASGGTQDTMTVLGAILDAGLEDVAAFAICDPEAVEQLIQAGVGTTATVMLGGKLDMPAIGLKGAPREVTGRVRIISDGLYRNLGPASKGVLMDLGRTVVLDTGKVEIVIISRQQEPNDKNCFLSLGIDPSKKRFLMLKSRVHWRAGFGDIIEDVIECAGTGVCTSDYDQLTFRNVRRPIYPLDNINDADARSSRGRTG
ncbi:MAG: M81 family metallopeptidase [Hyphomicrobiaceae bacterium]